MKSNYKYKPVGIAKLFLPFLACIAIVTIIQAAIFYQIHKNDAIEKEIVEMDRKVQLAVKDADFMRKTARTLAVQLFFDSTVQDLLYKEINYLDYDKYVRRLTVYKNIHPYLASVNVFNGENYYLVPSLKLQYSEEEFEDDGTKEIISNLWNRDLNTVYARQIPNPLYQVSSSAEQYFNGFSYVFSDDQMEGGQVASAIILNFSENWVTNTLDPFKNNGDHIFVIDEANRLVCSDGEIDAHTDLSSLEYIKNIRSSPDSSGDFEAYIDGERTIVSFSSSSITGWKVILLNPYNRIVGRLQTIFLVTCLIAISIFTFGGAIVFFFSRRLYIPWNYLYAENRQLQGEMRKNYLELRNDYLKRMVFGTVDNRSLSQMGENESYNIYLRQEGPLIMVLLRIDQFNDFCSTNNYEDRNIIKFATMNVLTELMSASLHCECVDLGDDRIVCLVEYDRNDYSSKDDRINAILTQFQEYIKKHLSISFTIVVSKVFNALIETPNVLSNCSEVSHARFLLGYGQIVHDNIDESKLSVPTYPAEMDKRICEALVLGHGDEAKKQLLKFLEQIASYDIANMNIFILNFLLSVHSTVELCMKNNQLQLLNYNFSEMVQQVQGIETSEEMAEYFYAFFDHLLMTVDEKKDSRRKQIITQIEEQINSSFGDVNLSTELLAERVNLTPNYIGRLFREEKMMTISSYISNARLQKACELLQNTRMSTEEIMQATGFISRSTFFTLFKKSFGVTPTQYRNDKAKQFAKSQGS